MEAAILRYSGADFGPRTPPFLVAKLESFPQLITNELSDCIPNIYVLELGELQLLGSAQFFTPYKCFPLISTNFSSRNKILFIFSRPKRLFIPWHVCQVSCLVMFI